MRQNLPDLAILDIMLEDEMDGGFDLCRDLRALAARFGDDRFLTAKLLQATWYADVTLPHTLVRIVVAEQLYRAWSVLHNHPYHRA